LDHADAGVEVEVAPPESAHLASTAAERREEPEGDRQFGLPALLGRGDEAQEGVGCLHRGGWNGSFGGEARSATLSCTQSHLTAWASDRRMKAC
jgi:hypothetical protein